MLNFIRYGSHFVIALGLSSSLFAATAQAADIARGVVFHDANGNQKFDDGEKGLPNIRVSNGLDITLTDIEGKYELPIDDDTILFVIKPSGWKTPFDENHLPQFHYVHKPNGSPKSEFPGVAPTGPLPESVDFPLTPQEEPEQFKAILFGDPQPRNQEEVDWIAHDVVEELIGTDATLGVTLGDIAFNNLDTMISLNKTIGLIGIPWYNVIGNHDINFDSKTRELANETYERIYGPSYYSFDYGRVHFVVVDDIEWIYDEAAERGRYRGGIGPKQLKFIANDLKLVPECQLVVLMMHIPLTGVQDRHGLYRLIEQRKYCISISGHTHHHEHVWIKKDDGWEGPEPHHHIVNVTVCGSWWSGMLDERGIPHSTMADGGPNGYSILKFDGVDYTLDYKAAGRDANYQMEIEAPEVVVKSAEEPAHVYVNFFNGSEKSVLEMKVGEGEWQQMEKVREVDPNYKRTVEREAGLLKDQEPPPFRKLPKPKVSTHLWKLELPQDLSEGSHLIHVKATDHWKRTFTAQRTIRITE